MPKGIYKHKSPSQETRRKISEAQQGEKGNNYGKHFSEETRRKISAAQIGNHKMFGKHLSKETRRKMSKAHCGEKNPSWGNSPSKETRKKISEAQRGEKSYRWKGGITPIYKKIRDSLEYRLWREAVFKRDSYTCQWCKDDKGGNLNADHIKPFSLFPELRFAIDNGRTLCIDCHRKTDTYGNRIYKIIHKYEA